MATDDRPHLQLRRLPRSASADTALAGVDVVGMGLGNGGVVMVSRQGFEPQMPDSKSGVLPLN